MIENKISSDGANEIFVDVSSDTALKYKAMVLEVWPETNFEGLHMLSWDPNKDKINLTYEVHPSDQIKKEFDVKDHHIYCDYYAIEFYLNKKIKILKIYDQNLQQHPLPSLPPGSRIDVLKSGIGVYYGPNVNNLRKIYFFHNNVEWIRTWFKDLTIPFVTPKYKFTIFGLEFDVNTLEAKHISQYDIKDINNIYNEDSLKQ
jgi:hypothetical protein